MPREIDCPDCGGNGWIVISKDFPCATCKTAGKITVYSEVELKEAVKEERESCVLDISQWVHEWKKKTYVKPYIDIVLKGMVEAIKARTTI